MAETSLVNMAVAMGGSARSGNIIVIGGGVLKTLNLKIVGVSPAGYIRTILIPKASAQGAVGSSYRKGEKTVVPVTFQAIKSATGNIHITDNAA